MVFASSVKSLKISYHFKSFWLENFDLDKLVIDIWKDNNMFAPDVKLSNNLCVIQENLLFGIKECSAI